MPTTTISPGDVVVPMSTILDALEGVLTAEEREALFAQLIELRPAGVAPGDLITAELFNDMSFRLGDLQEQVIDLAARLLALEGGTATLKRPVITSFDPSIVRTGTQFAVIGDGLDAAHMQEIRIEDTLVPVSRIKAGSTSRRMLLDAPAIIGLPAAGGPVIMTLTTAAGSGQGTYVQLPGVAADIQANVAFVPKGLVPDEPLVANKDYDVSIQLDIHSSHDETFDLAAAFDQAGWTVASITPAKITVTSDSAAAGHSDTVKIKVRSGAAGAANLSLKVQGETFTSFEQLMVPALKLEIAQAAQLPSEKIKFTNISVAGPHGWDGAAGEIMIHKPSVSSPQAVLTVFTQLDLAETFVLSGLACDPASDWSAVFDGETSFAIGTVGSVKQIKVRITPRQAGGQFVAANGTIAFKIASQAGQDQRPFNAKLRVVG
jgi:hypothetical protein